MDDNQCGTSAPENKGFDPLAQIEAAAEEAERREQEARAAWSRLPLAERKANTRVTITQEDHPLNIEAAIRILAEEEAQTIECGSPEYWTAYRVYYTGVSIEQGVRLAAQYGADDEETTRMMFEEAAKRCDANPKEQRGRVVKQPVFEAWCKATHQTAIRDGIYPGYGDTYLHTSDLRARIERQFMVLDQADTRPARPTSLRQFLYTTTPAPERQDLMPGWIGSGRTILVAGRGGTHKSRLILQLCFCLLYDRDLFVEKLRDGPGSGNPATGDHRRAGGVKVGHIDFLSYEDDNDEVLRRVEKMKAGFRFDGEHAYRCDDFAFWPLAKSRPPLLIVDELGNVELTDFGAQMLWHWRELAGDQGVCNDGHLVIWLDSLFNAVQFQGNAKNIDICAQHAIAVLDHWCKVLGATIVAPFHISRAGEARGDTGYSPAFEDTARQVLTLAANVSRVKGGRPNQFEPNGEFTFRVHKWTGGPQGKKVVFRFHEGQLITYQPVNAGDYEPPAEVAADIVASATYSAEDRARLADPMLLDDERDEIERRSTERLRRKGNGWVCWYDGALVAGSVWINNFRARTGQPHAGEAAFTEACELAHQNGLLGYRASDRTARGNKRLPAGYYLMPASPVTSAAGEDDIEDKDW